MMPELIAAATRTGRECGCPEYVIRCAHVDGAPRVVWLSDETAWTRISCPGSYHHMDYPYKAFCGTIVPAVCGCDTPTMQSRAGSIRLVARADTLAEAEAAFARYEALLLGREVE